MAKHDLSLKCDVLFDGFPQPWMYRVGPYVGNRTHGDIEQAQRWERREICYTVCFLFKEWSSRGALIKGAWYRIGAGIFEVVA